MTNNTSTAPAAASSPTSTTSVLDVRGLNSGYGPLQVLWDVSLDVSHGTVAVVLGVNGAGKSTLLRTIAGDLRAIAGTVTVDGVDMTRQDSATRLSSGLAWVPEGRNVFQDLTVRDNLRISAKLAKVADRYAEREQMIFDLFPAMAEKIDAPAGTLSGGQQQILAISRALIRDPKVAMLDEPTVGLAPSIVDRLGEAIAETTKVGVSWLIAEQNLAWLAPITTSTFVLQGGRITRRGGPEVIGSREAIRKAFFESTDTI
ncbi:ATP-binding cassette domain-containing protein [Aeromicrobium sp. 636]|uniref:ABC transporter ATP-binding protein n=1 Tax=Aeromicrobium senzhongii TaxID=2663859 RepID=A0A8I0K142_9ACTN|nr:MULTISPECIES: ABC transporter ATP-binding protein [Aeromicrobium]MBC9226493.1 ABC transporter ATP-binding protein [Aeromicrobium senzhongii]MCQ3998597.1 ATP-binding cassette domain-containing protein [Aeromicrobium sp. 636]